VRDFVWLTRHLPKDGHVFAHDVTSGLPMLALMGPRSRALLQAVSNADLSNDAFPFGTGREIELGYAKVRASRVTFVGELGFELLIPAEFALHVFDTLVAAGAEFSLKHGGYFAINCLRMEKGYRHWGHDIGEDDTPLQAGLGFAVAWNKTGGFVGREALVAQRDAGPLTRRLVQVQMLGQDAPLLYHEEPIWRAGKIVGSITSGGYGHRIGASLGMGYVACPNGVTNTWLAAETLEVEIAWKRYPAKAQLAPWYDPTALRAKA